MPHYVTSGPGGPATDNALSHVMHVSREFAVGFAQLADFGRHDTLDLPEHVIDALDRAALALGNLHEVCAVEADERDLIHGA